MSADTAGSPGKEPRLYEVIRAINLPLTILGAERRLFFLAAVVSAATFNFFGSLRAAALMYGALYLSARWVTAQDLALPRIFLNSAGLRVRYDASSFDASQAMRVRP